MVMNKPIKSLTIFCMINVAISTIVGTILVRKVIAPLVELPFSSLFWEIVTMAVLALIASVVYAYIIRKRRK
jgi:membrane protein implicated in regulation of membrane protease activity